MITVLFLFTVLIEAMLRYVQCAHMHLAESVALSDHSIQWSVALFNELRKQKLHKTTSIRPTVFNKISTKIRGC